MVVSKYNELATQNSLQRLRISTLIPVGNIKLRKMIYLKIVIMLPLRFGRTSYGFAHTSQKLS